ASTYGMPVLAMTYARGPGIDETDANNLGHAVRVAEELGADLVKTAYSGSADTFEHVVSSTRLPVLIAGGEPETDRSLLESIEGAMNAGASGVSIGRSVFQHEDPEAMTRAVSTIVHDGASSSEALKVVERG
ncbi:MAG: DUF561 domain-containing protein, partial [Halobacteriaceae archaeon]